MESKLVQLGEEVYTEKREKLESVYLGKIVAIETESRDVAGVGESLDEAYENALERYPGRHFYFRKVGPCPTTDYLF